VGPGSLRRQDVAAERRLADLETTLAQVKLDVYETIRRWVLKFGPLFAKELRRRRHRPTSKWHLDESVPRRLPQ
jgi:transposase-like protein